MFWYEDEVKGLENKIANLSYEPKTVFYGSSSIRLWSSLDEDFEGLEPLNLGFGGSTLAACTWFFERIFACLKPESIIIYAGDNDLGDGRHAEEVYIFYQQLTQQILNRFGEIPITFISIKPSLNRFNILDRIAYSNKLISAEIEKHQNQFYLDVYNLMFDGNGIPDKLLFEADGLHLSERGYDLWIKLLKTHLQKNKTGLIT